MDAPDLCGSCRRWALGLRRDFLGASAVSCGICRSIRDIHEKIQNPIYTEEDGRVIWNHLSQLSTFLLDLERLRAKKRGFEEQNDIGIRTTGETDVALQTTSAKVRPTAPADDYSYYSEEGEEEEERSQDNPVDIPVLPTPRQPPRPPSPPERLPNNTGSRLTKSGRKKKRTGGGQKRKDWLKSKIQQRRVYKANRRRCSDLRSLP